MIIHQNAIPEAMVFFSHIWFTAQCTPGPISAWDQNHGNNKDKNKRQLSREEDTPAFIVGYCCCKQRVTETSKCQEEKSKSSGGIWGCDRSVCVQAAAKVQLVHHRLRYSFLTAGPHLVRCGCSEFLANSATILHVYA
jgi:hypothetical protein